MNATAWHLHASGRLAASPADSRDPPPRLELAHYAGYGPGVELLGTVDGRRVVELGCGPGRNLAHLVAHHGAIGVGVDAVPAQVDRAHGYYGHLRDITFTTADAVTYLATTGIIDICISVFGAIGFTAPEPLLRAITMRLRPGGRLVFSVPYQDDDADPQPIVEILSVADGCSVPIARWALTPERWAQVVQRAGLTLVDLHVVRGPRSVPDAKVCLVAVAVRP